MDEKDIRFLYQLLKLRKPLENISHKNMPSYNEHTKFVKSKPYQKWYIIFENKKKIGSTYISKQDEISMHFLPKFDSNKNMNHVLELILEKHPKSRYLANTNYKNKSLITFYKNNGFKLIQYTFELVKEKNLK
ncbi:hypothetical protein Nmar_0133 [Nitrosopumilus maritimus SCM1]|uniref:N-acetyltransferase domain-containing protein n=1 Tax=Nitrosopumilus maritimus (strain SCM1) TaxID=436308 RepID=A9A1R2_NITMS|nr:hypothetical protein Nmar_0133 [Nitrosopumilus maritimus SCM1]